MTGLYVIWTSRRNDQLVLRRRGYRQVEIDGAKACFREDHNTDFLGAREGNQVRMSSQWIADIRTVAEDPASTAFFVEMRNRESVEDAIRRGLALPVSRSDHPSILVDVERRLCADFTR